MAWRLVDLQNQVCLKILTHGYQNKLVTDNYVRLGTTYGGWWIPGEVMSVQNQPKLLISAGIGFDVSFDAELANLGFEIVCIDPLPEAIEYSKSALAACGNVEYINSGLAASSGIRNFYPPVNATHDSWSLINVQHGDEKHVKQYATVSLEEVLNSFQNANHFTYLKMDIEGGEKEVLEALLNSTSEISFLGVELDFISLIPFLNLLDRIREVFNGRKLMLSLHKKGYKFVGNENFNFFWVSE